MRLLLDSHVFLWWTLESPELSAPTIEAIVGASQVFVSFVTPWELEIEAAKGLIRLPARLWTDLEQDRFTMLAATLGDCLAAARLPPHHRDPVDRMLIAQAVARRLTIATANRTLSAYDVDILPA